MNSRSSDVNPETDGPVTYVEVAAAAMRRQEDMRNAENGWAPCVPIGLSFALQVEDLRKAEVDLGAAKAVLANAEAGLERDHPQLAAAHAVLGFSGDAESVPWKAVVSATERDPASEQDFIHAYWTIKRSADRQARTIAAAREAVIRISQLITTAEALPWPASWPIQLARLWERLGGTGASASAWAQAGWRPDEVLTYEHFCDQWNAALPSRVVAESVPEHRNDNSPGSGPLGLGSDVPELVRSPQSGRWLCGNTEGTGEDTQGEWHRQGHS
jgi:hypothetical protein